MAFYQNIPYCGGGKFKKMDIYYPDQQTSSMPTIVYIHSGGWIDGDKSEVTWAFLNDLLNRGYVIFSVNYRLAPDNPFPAQIEDIKCAISTVKKNARGFHIDPERIGLFGESAGGHLAAITGLTSKADGFDPDASLDSSSNVKAVAIVNGPTKINLVTIPGWTDIIVATFGRHPPSSEEYRRASPITYVTEDDPPFLVIHGNLDSTISIRQSNFFFEALCNANVPAELIIVKYANHWFAFEDAVTTPSISDLSIWIADFFDKYMPQPVQSP
jgi:acetyl esterase/lipase